MNILVIDDEPLIHISIEKLISSCGEDIHVFHAYNGHEMLSVLSEHEFLLAFVDIRIPGISGLEAISRAKEIAPMTRYYIMTGFDEFEYAKQAVKLKVDDYLMKPLDRKTIQDCIESSLALAHAAQREQKTIFRNWLESTLNHREGSLEKYTGYYCSLILITIDSPDFPKDTLMQKFTPYNRNFVSSFVDNQIILLCFAEDAGLLRDMSKSLSLVPCQEGITLFASSVTKEPAALKAALQQLLSCACLRVSNGIEKFYSLKPLLLLEKETELLPLCQACLEWQKAYFEKNYFNFVNQTEFICSFLETGESDPKYRDHIRLFFARTLSHPSLPPCDPSELRKYFYQCSKTLFQSSREEQRIHAILQYIQSHYADNISAASLSEQFGLSSSYISNLIKQELGIRYNDYITQLRLNKAKELLISTNQSVKDITTACGYYSQSHFTRLFIDREGCTPTEYRKNNLPK